MKGQTKIIPVDWSAGLREIGGYFELELSSGRPFHHGTLAFDSAHNALRYYLCKKKVRHIYIPYYICATITEAIHKEGVACDFYFISDDLKPVWQKLSGKPDAILLVNYFGLLALNENMIPADFKHIIIDNSQAFYAPANIGQATIYSPRKFFGVPDGGYLASDLENNEDLALAQSYQRFGHLLMRSDLDANKGYSEFRKNENALSESEPRRMSRLTEKLLKSIDYSGSQIRRRQNFLRVHDALTKFNQLSINPVETDTPMIYPLLTENSGLRSYLIEKKIYVAQYWREVLSSVPENSFEYKLADNLIALPIDQRWDDTDMERLIDCVTGYLAG